MLSIATGARHKRKISSYDLRQEKKVQTIQQQIRNQEKRQQQISEIVGLLNHCLAIKWSNEVAAARDLLLKTGERK
jgi:hypothetical protein